MSDGYHADTHCAVLVFRRECGREPAEGTYLHSVNYQVLARDGYRVLPNGDRNCGPDFDVGIVADLIEDTRNRRVGCRGRTSGTLCMTLLRQKQGHEAHDAQCCPRLRQSVNFGCQVASHICCALATDREVLFATKLAPEG